MQWCAPISDHLTSKFRSRPQGRMACLIRTLDNTLSSVPNHFTRAFALFWEMLGPARIYVAAISATVVLLAAVGLWHIIGPTRQPERSADDQALVKSTPPPVAPKTQAASSPAPLPTTSTVARISPGVEQSSPTPTSAPATAPELGRAIAITDLSQTQQRGPRGESFIVARIGLTPRSTEEKGAIEIRVFFYDLTPNNEMRPTDAQVTYQWLTAVRDWSDPTPKYLAATYLKQRPFHRMPERLRYGGFIVRVYAGGKLQDERSEPEGLIAGLRSNAAPPTSSGPLPPSSFAPHPSLSPAPMVAPIASPTAAVATSPTPQKSTASTTTVPSPTASRRTPGEDGDLPFGKPVPGKPGFVSSPYDPKFLIDVRGFPPGTLVNDPNTNKPFRVP